MPRGKRTPARRPSSRPPIPKRRSKKKVSSPRSNSIHVNIARRDLIIEKARTGSFVILGQIPLNDAVRDHVTQRLRNGSPTDFTIVFRHSDFLDECYVVISFGNAPTHQRVLAVSSFLCPEHFHAFRHVVAASPIQTCADLCRLYEQHYVVAHFNSDSGCLVVSANFNAFDAFESGTDASELEPPVTQQARQAFRRVLGSLTKIGGTRADAALDSDGKDVPGAFSEGALAEAVYDALAPQYTSATLSAAETEEQLEQNRKVLARLPAGFLPHLLPYQVRGLSWMLAREERPSVVGLPTTGPLSLWKMWWSPCGRHIFYNMLNGAMCLRHDVIDLTEPSITGNARHFAPPQWMPPPRHVAQCGGILADEMGLGKTVVFLALLLATVTSTNARVKRELILPVISAAPTVDRQPSSRLQPDQLEKMTIVDLAKILRERGLSTRGSRKDMLGRLTQDNSAGSPRTNSRRSRRGSHGGTKKCVCGLDIAPHAATVACARCNQQAHTVCIGHVSNRGASIPSADTTDQSAEGKFDALNPTTPLCFTCRSYIFSPSDRKHEISGAPQNTTVNATCVVNSNATLIICPSSLISQWQSEVNKHTAPGWIRVTVYPGIREIMKAAVSSQKRRQQPRRVSGSNPTAKWESLAKMLDPRQLASCAEVVLTSYSVLQTEFHFKVGKRNMAAGRQYHTVASPLRQIYWKRLVLDEAQMIDRPTAQSAAFCSEIFSQFRW